MRLLVKQIARHIAPRLVRVNPEACIAKVVGHGGGCLLFDHLVAEFRQTGFEQAVKFFPLVGGCNTSHT